MRTTLDIDEELIAEVERVTGEKSKSKAVNTALGEYLEMKAIEALRAMSGTIDLVDIHDELEEMELKEQKELWRPENKGHDHS